MSKFYVTLTWDNFPEGGSYGTVVEANCHEDAEDLARREMAQIRADDYDEMDISTCANCGNTDQDGSDICIDCGGTEWETNWAVDRMLDDYAQEWHVIDCFRIEDWNHLPQNVVKVLELSTTHVTEETAKKLEAQLASSYPKDPYGWRIYVQASASTFPDIEACLAHARKLGCTWIMFDRDVEPIKELPTYDW